MRMLLKQKVIRSEVSGDKVTKLVLETTDQEQVNEIEKLMLDTYLFVDVDIKPSEE